MYSALPLKLACHSWFSGLRRSSHIHKAFGIAPNEKDSTCLVTTGAIHKYFTSSDPQRDDLFCHSFWHLIWKYIYNYIYGIYFLTFYSGILFDILFWHSLVAFYPTFSSDMGTAGPQRQAHWHLALAVGSEPRAELWSSRLRSGSAHWDLETLAWQGGKNKSHRHPYREMFNCFPLRSLEKWDIHLTTSIYIYHTL